MISTASRSSHRKFSIKNVFLNLLQNSQENTCVGNSFLIKNTLLTEHLERLLLRVSGFRFENACTKPLSPAIRNSGFNRSTLQKYQINWFIHWLLNVSYWLGQDSLNPLSAKLTNGQTHSNNSSANCRRIVWVCLVIFSDWRLTG